MNDRFRCLSTILHLAKAFADHDSVTPRLYVITANAQPALGTEPLAVEQAAVWGLGRVVGHQEFVDRWGGLIDIDDADDRTETGSRICAHILADEPEDQIAIRGRTTLGSETSLEHGPDTTLPNQTHA